MNIVTEFQRIQEVRDVKLLDRSMGLSFVCPAELADAEAFYVALEPGPELVRSPHTVAAGQVSLEAAAEGFVRVTVLFDRPLIAALMAPGGRRRCMNLYRLGWSLPVVQVAAEVWTSHFAHALELFAVSKSRIGGNHWGVDAVFLVDGRLHMYGWAVAPAGWERTAPGIQVDGVPADVYAMTPPHRDLYWLLASDRLEGFHAVAPSDALGRYVRMTLTYAGDERQRIVRFPLYQFLGDVANEGDALPDLAAIHRVSGPHANATSFVNSGKSDFERFKLLIAKHASLEPGMKLLDWGVGCGRIARHFVREGHDMHGIDIDQENVRWCNEHIGQGKYHCVDLYPPTPLPANSYDIIISSSVLSHLTEPAMRSWLAEIARLLTPGGRALLSYNGDGTSFLWAGTSVDALESLTGKGIFDDWRTPDLDGAVRDAETYYRLTMFRSEVAQRIFGEYFTVHGVELGVTSGHQDIVVLQKKE